MPSRRAIKRSSHFLKGLFRSHSALLAIVFVFVSLKLLALSRINFIEWDESVYIGMGKYIYSSGSVGMFEDIRPLMLPLITGLFWRLGLDVVFFSGIAAIGFAVAAIILTYSIGLRIRKGIGVGAAALLAFTPLFFLHSSEILTEIPSTAFALAAMLLFLKEKRFFAGMCAGLSFLFKFPQALMFLALAFVALVLYRKHRHLLPLTAGFLVATAPFFAFNIAHYPYGNILTNMLHTIISASVYTHNIVAVPKDNLFDTNYMLYYPLYLTIVEGNYLLIFSLIGIALSVRPLLGRHPGADAQKIMAVILVAFLFYFISHVFFILPKEGRYALQFLPYLALLAAAGAHWLYHHNPRRFRWNAAKLALVAVLALTLASALRLDARDYTWKSTEELPIVTELYRYLERNHLSPVLSADPAVAAYSDVKVIPLYMNINSSLKIYHQNIGEARAVLIFTNFYRCDVYGEFCSEIEKELFREVRKNRELVHVRHNREDYYLFEVVR